MTRNLTTLLLTFALATGVQAAPPGTVICPSNASGWTNAATPNQGSHKPGEGIGGADDTYAMDLNLNVPTSDSDRGKPVYAIADGFVERNISGWSGTGYGQLLLKHFNPDGSGWYSGYLHMTNITPLKGSQGAYVRAGTQIGLIGNVSTDKIPYHLHFIVYELVGSTLRSRSVGLKYVAERPNITTIDSVLINGQVVNRSPFPVPRNRAFSMTATLRSTGSDTITANYYLILSRDIPGASFAGIVDDRNKSISLSRNQQRRFDFSKSSLVSPAGIYWLQLYHDDGTSGPAALKRVSGNNPIAIDLR